jgi:hypothetical protein
MTEVGKVFQLVQTLTQPAIQGAAVSTYMR